MKIKITNEAMFNKDTASQKLVSQLKRIFGEDRSDCIIYYRYPIYPSENLFIPSIVLFDREYGVFVFNASSLETYSKTGVDDKLMDLKEYVYSLKNDIDHPRKNLAGKVDAKYGLYYPFVASIESPPKEILFGDIDKTFLSQLRKNPLSVEEWKSLLNIIHNLGGLSRNTATQVVSPPETLKEAIILNNQKICIFDDNQEDSAIMENSGGMRIRGLAGTGKTIVLAWKAAYLHYLYPNKKILYTFYTKSLYNQIKYFVITFYKKYSPYKEPNWDNLNILHAWGGRTREGVYYNTCLSSGVKPEALNAYRLHKQPFGMVCQNLLKQRISPVYDYVLVDEAQDLPQNYFRLLEKLSLEDKAITIAYDELQSLEDVGMPNFGELFGYDEFGKDLVPLNEARNDKVLKKSYRNPIEVLHTAVALGFGIYSPKGFTQMIERETDWKAVGYNLVKGKLEHGKNLELERPKENSPNNITEIYNKIPPLNMNTFEDKNKEIKYVSNKIHEFISKEKVNPKDIMVVNLSGRTQKTDFIKLRGELFAHGINSKIPGYDDKAEDFFIDEHVTLATALRAKGNEAPIVFVMGLEKIIETTDEVWQRLVRSFAFVSITRAKGWCFLSGSGGSKDILLKEYNDIQKDFPKLKFNFPSAAEIKKIRQINYITKDEVSKKEYFDDVDAINKLINTNSQYLPEDLLKRLKDKLERKFDD